MRTLVLSFFLIFHTWLCGEQTIPITKIPDLFTESEAASIQADLDHLLYPWKLSKHRKLSATQLQQFDILITASKKKYNFIKLKFTSDHKLTKKSVKTLHKKLISPQSSIKPFLKDLKKITFEPALRAVHQFASHARLTGEHYIRCDIRGFAIYLDKEPEGALSNVLGWHWDYCSHSTLLIELSTDFEEAELLFARNLNLPPLRDCTKPANHYDAVPDESTLVRVHYPRNGALIFPSERGGVLHCPQSYIVPSGKRGVLLRVILQVVLMDQEWLKLSKKSSTD